MLSERELRRLKRAAYEMRHDILDLCFACGEQKGHLGGCMSVVELLATLYLKTMNIQDEEIRCERWDERDRFVMSKGHAGIALYAALRQAGVLSEEQLHAGIRGDGTILYRHPKFNPENGIECSVGSLGMGIGFAVGLVEAAKRKKQTHRVFVILGDGECDEGSVWESLAYAAHHNMEQLIVIVDRNALQLDGKTQEVLDLGDLEEKFKAFGFEAISIDGHNFEQINEALEAQHKGKPLAIIAHTVKGKGVSFAEDKTEWHDNVLTEELYCLALRELETAYSTEANDESSAHAPVRHISLEREARTQNEDTLTLCGSADMIEEFARLGSGNIVGRIAEEIAGVDPQFSLVYSDCANRIGISRLRQEYPQMCYETGIAEQNQLMVAVALALEGFNVFAVAYAPFITARVLDQIRANMGYMKSPVKLIGLSAGFAASDLGATHTALEDIADLRAIPNLTVLCPADCFETAKMMIAAAKMKTPVYIRITKGLTPDHRIYEKDYALEIGKAVTLREGNDVVVFGCGAVLSEVLGAAEKLEAHGISCKVVNMHTIKPLDKGALEEALGAKLIVTVEEHSIIGGLGGAVAEHLVSCVRHAPLLRLGVPDRYYVADLPSREMERAGLTAQGITECILCRLKEISQFENRENC